MTSTPAIMEPLPAASVACTDLPLLDVEDWTAAMWCSSSIMAVTVPWWWEWPKACLLWLPSGAVRVGGHFIKEDEKPTREALHEQEQEEHVCFLSSEAKLHPPGKLLGCLMVAP